MENKHDLNISGKSNKSNLIGILLVVMAITGYSLFLNPLNAQMDDLQADIEAKNVELADVSAQIEEYKAAQEEFDLTTEVSRLNSLKAIPVGANQDDVIRDLVEVAENYDITLNSISFGLGRSQIEGIGSLRVNASFEGNYTDLIDFLEGIEQNERLFVVENISVQVSTLEISKIERANFSLTIQSFYQEG